MSARKHILVVDDELPIRTLLKCMLACGGHAVEPAGAGSEALALPAADRFDLVVTDNCMPGMSGVDLAAAIKRRFPFLPVVMLSANPPLENLACLDVILHKPEGISKLLQVVNTTPGGRGGSQTESGCKPDAPQGENGR